MLHIAIIEDERDQRELLVKYLKQYSKESNVLIDIYTFKDGKDIVKQYQKKYDILLLDIQMEFIDGMKTAEIIRKTDEDVVIIFITNLVQYAIQGYSVNAMNYIVKPVNYELFCNKLERALDRINKRKSKYINIKTNNELIHLEHSMIIFVEITHRKLAIHTNGQVYSCNQPLKNVIEELGSRHFFRCHVAYLVNLKYVEKISESSAMVAGKEILVSRNRRKDFINALTNYKGDEL